jgi:hypothetical protein
MGMVAGLGSVKSFYTTADELPAGSEGLVVMLNKADDGFPAGSIVTYKNGTWVEFEGAIMA